MPEVIAWLDGQIWALDPDEDFDGVGLPRMKELLRRKARERGMKIRTDITRPEHVNSGTVDKIGLLVVQAYAASAEELTLWARKDAEKGERLREAAQIDEEYERAMFEHQEEERRRVARPQSVREQAIPDWDFQ